ncbi:MAG: preprotein translocase subunit YajC [Bacilli bacterium]|nr:preprotein translocase subunit YajC [Bacilli bacterium]MDD4801393.1 preprotein translocase subunit YajC [Syntrophomonas sp.]
MATQQGWITVLIYCAVCLGIFYFFLVMPRKKQDKKHKELLANIKRGDLIVTVGGIRGEITKVKEETVLIKSNENTEIEFVKSAIAYKVDEQ